MYKNEEFERRQTHHEAEVKSDQAHSRLHEEAIRSFSHRTNRKGHNSEAKPSGREAHREADGAAFSQHGYWSTEQEKYNNQGLMLVLNGDTLESVARKALLLRGASIEGPDAIEDEADRIRALNMKRPNMAYLEHSHRIKPGMILDITEPRIGPDIHTAWLSWKDAPAGETTFVHRGERVVTQPGAKVIVEPGAAAVVTSGASSFGYNGSYIESMPGSITVSAGEVAAANGSRVIKLRDNQQVAQLSPAQLRNPQLFPG